ncbi:MAG: hypothetical protein HY586_05765 [Candidatus Omnitrophica bacterium]|nr:hypothetical protein [Candidatus Omnitrophota bacterium]
MKPIKITLGIALILAAMAGGAVAGDKFYVPSWNLPQGDITTFPKGHKVSTQFMPERIVSYDKQHMPWFESTLKPQHVKK